VTDKPDMCAALRKWADRLQAEGSAIGESLAAYADAWEAERAASAEEARKLPTVMGARIEELEEALQQSIDSNVDKIMAMTDDQVAALTRLDGSNPEDSARLGKQACELAIAAVRIAEQDEEIARLRSALNAMLTHMGMDEDDWNKSTFDQARNALKEKTQ
jgi:hypothetical protein